MCGIVGQISFSGRDSGEGLRSLIGMMMRRGPDDEGVWSDDQGCDLGFRRLSVLDLTPNGRQPMQTDDGRHVLVYNGEVYNFRELRHDLESEGVRFRSTGDTEVVLYALSRWGPAAFSRFNGMFALGLYDRLTRRLLLGRDHAGIKPLYYMSIPRGLVFASQYDQILRHPWSRLLGVDLEAVALYLRLGYIPAPHALLKNTHMLEAGTWLEIDQEQQLRSERYFEFPVFREPDLHGDQACEAVDAAVTAAVQRQLVSDVPVGSFLSGGVDSPLVTAKVRRCSTKDFVAFTVGTAGDVLDETADAEAYANEIGVEHRVEQITQNQALELLYDVVRACGEPFADYSIFPTLFLARSARRHVRVLLSGDGGDELFWGYTGRLSSFLDRVESWDTSARRSREAPGMPVRSGRLDPGNWYREKHCHFPVVWLERIFPGLPEPPRGFGLYTYTGSGSDRAAQWLRWNEYTGHLTMVLLKVDRASMYQSLEVRVPLLDREVVDLAGRIDWRTCYEPERGVGKLPLRHALGRHFSRQTYAKRGFSVAMGEWLRGSLKPVFEQIVLPRKEILGFPIRGDQLREVFHRHVARNENHERGLWLLLSLALWEDQHYRDR